MKQRNNIGKFIRTVFNQKCDTCGNPYYNPNSKSKYCGRKCYYEMKLIRKDRVDWTPEMRERMSKNFTGKNNPAYGKTGWSKGKNRPEITGANHSFWKGGFSISRNGYKVIQNIKETNGDKKLEHRKIMEDYLGRNLTSDEIIHHINGNKLDNRIINLQIVTRSEHIKIHFWNQGEQK